MDSYQAVYDAVRSKIGSVDMAQAVTDAINQQASGLSYAIDAVRLEYAAAADAQRVAAQEAQRPSVLYRPALSMDGDQWCALYGDNLQEGVCGFGETPAAAMEAFDNEWRTAQAGRAAAALATPNGGAA